MAVGRSRAPHQLGRDRAVASRAPTTLRGACARDCIVFVQEYALPHLGCEWQNRAAHRPLARPWPFGSAVGGPRAGALTVG
eukprot:8784774-Alexandrium_andersonii.AAC.1